MLPHGSGGPLQVRQVTTTTRIRAIPFPYTVVEGLPSARLIVCSGLQFLAMGRTPDAQEIRMHQDQFLSWGRIQPTRELCANFKINGIRVENPTFTKWSSATLNTHGDEWF